MEANSAIQKPQTRSCEILFVLDHSGSMQNFATDAIEGFNRFLKLQYSAAQPDATMALILFDSGYNVVYPSCPIKSMPTLTKQTFIPEGGTALFDAIGQTIADGMKRHSTEGRPRRTLVVLLTDGEDEHSKEYRATTIKPLITRVRAHFGWEFILIGVGTNAERTARDIGILPHLALPVKANTKGMREAYAAASCAAQAALKGEEIRLLGEAK